MQLSGTKLKHEKEKKKKLEPNEKKFSTEGRLNFEVFFGPLKKFEQSYHGIMVMTPSWLVVGRGSFPFASNQMPFSRGKGWNQTR